MPAPLRRALVSLPLPLLALALALGLGAALHHPGRAAAATPCTSVTLAALPLSQQSVGSAVRLTAAAQGCPSPRYAFWLLPSGGAWIQARAYAYEGLFIWDTSNWPANSYLIDVWAEDASSTASWDTYTYISYTLTGGTPGVPALSAPANGASGQSVTPVLSWSAPAGAIPGSTIYTVGLWDTAPLPNGTWLGGLPPTTSTSVTVPLSMGLTLGHTYDWAVSACNGNFCSAYTSPWFAFTTASTPGTALELSPANGATNQALTPTLSWSQPSGAIPGTTTYTVSLYDPYGEPGGHLLGDLAPTTSLSVSVPAGEGLLYGQAYYWNVNACTGASCSGYTGTWFSFTTLPQPPATASGAGNTVVVNPDFGGAAQSNNGAPLGWGVGPSGPPANYQYWSTPLTLDFSGSCAGGGSCSLFRVGYLLVDNVQGGVNNGSGVQVKWHNTQTGGDTLLYTDNRPGFTPANVWEEALVQVPAALGATGSVVVVLISAPADGAAQYPWVAYVDRLDGPTAHAVPSVGLAAAPRFPRTLSAASGAGVDTVSGALNLGATDLSVPGVAGGLSFSRAYSTHSLIPLATHPLGYRWTHNWQAGLQFVGTGVVVYTPGGGVYNFAGNGSGGWSAPKGVTAGFAPSGPNAYTLTTADQRRYAFTLVTIGGSGGSATCADGLCRVSDPGVNSRLKMHPGFTAKLHQAAA